MLTLQDAFWQCKTFPGELCPALDTPRPSAEGQRHVRGARDGDVELLQPGRRISRCSRQLLRAAGIWLPGHRQVRSVHPVPRGDTGDRIGRRIHGHIGLRAAGTTAGHRDLGPVGVAARTAATVADALGIFSTYMAAYRPVIAMKAAPLADPYRPCSNQPPAVR